jgi:2-methylisocitrate lyase-like PEP mutase family enzyme
MNIEIEYDLTGGTKDYAMYTELGNAGVHAVVVAARANQLTWAQVVNTLRQLAKQEPFAESMDTMVRECVYSALGYDNNEQPFYGA